MYQSELTLESNLQFKQNHSANWHFDLLHPLRNWFENVDVRKPELARLICKLIPSQCPFEQDVVLFGRTVAHIPPMCKLNPLYEQFVGLRFRALCYLVDECGEDIIG